jgi:uroporphyrinogen-III decarboxylase
MHTFMHSCGNILEIIPDMIEIGLDVLQLDQQDNMGIDALSRVGQGKLCFFCPVDIQTILIKPDNRAEIERRVKELITRLGTTEGGFIAKTYPQPDAIRIPPYNIKMMCESFRSFTL